MKKSKAQKEMGLLKFIYGDQIIGQVSERYAEAVLTALTEKFEGKYDFFVSDYHGLRYSTKLIKVNGSMDEVDRMYAFGFTEGYNYDRGILELVKQK